MRCYLPSSEEWLLGERDHCTERLVANEGLSKQTTVWRFDYLLVTIADSTVYLMKLVTTAVCLRARAQCSHNRSRDETIRHQKNQKFFLKYIL